MRDVNYGWLLRYLHANTASFFFIFVYLHIARGLYYGSYRSPRVLPWSVGVIIFIVMMATLMWPNWSTYYTAYPVEPLLALNLPLLPFSRPHYKALSRIGPHDYAVLCQITCGMLGDWWGDSIPGQILPSVRFNIEQAMSNSDYILWLTDWFHRHGYCSTSQPKLTPKVESKNDKRTNKAEPRFNWRLSLFTYTSLHWIYADFYKRVDGELVKVVPEWIGVFLSPLGLAALIMQDGSRQMGQGIYLALNSFTYEECLFIANLLTEIYGLKTSVIKTGTEGQWRVTVWKESMPRLVEIVRPHMAPGIIDRKLTGYV